MKLKRFEEINENQYDRTSSPNGGDDGNGIGRSTRKYTEDENQYDRTCSPNGGDDDKEPKSYIIDALLALTKVETIIGNNDGIGDLTYSERGLLFKLKCDLDFFLDNTSLG
jgi:hypothetical protein